MKQNEAEGPGSEMETPSSTVQGLVMGTPSAATQDEGKSVAPGIERDSTSSTAEAPPLTDPGLADKITNVLLKEPVETAPGTSLPKTSKLGKEILALPIDMALRGSPKPERELPLVTPIPETSKPGTESSTSTPFPETSKSLLVTPFPETSKTGSPLPVTANPGTETVSMTLLSETSDTAPLDALETTSQTTTEVALFPVPAPETADIVPSVALGYLAVGSASNEVSSFKTLPVDMSEHTQSVSLIEPLSSDTEGVTPQPFGSVDFILTPANTRLMQVAPCPVASESRLEPISTAVTVAKSADQAFLSATTVAIDVLPTHSSPSGTANPAKEQLPNSGSISQQATSNVIAGTSSSMGYQTSNPFLAMEATKVINKGSSWLSETTSVHSVASTFDNNMVSSVEGETVLIVENLGLTSQTTNKANGNLPGMVGNSDLQKEADIKANSENMHAEGNGLVGQKIRKKFGRKFFEGEIAEYNSELHWYKVVYEDGDEEELDLREVKRILFLNEVEEDQRSAKKRHRRFRSISNSLKRFI